MPDVGLGSVAIFWLPLGAGGHVVRLNGLAYERLVAVRERRRPCALYHAALELRTPEGRSTVEMAPAWSRAAPDRGVVGEGPVGLGPLRRWALFRYEVRVWPEGVIPDVAEAVDSPRTLSGDPEVARRIVRLASAAPMPVWGRDGLGAGEMWNSNSLIAWLLERAGIAADAVRPPVGGRAPGWAAGVAVAQRSVARATD